MAINQVSNNQPDITSRYNDAQRAQRKSPEDQGLQQGRQLQDNGAATEDVKVSLSSQKKTETKGRVNAERTEPQRQEQQIQNLETSRAIQAYENANRAAASDDTAAGNSRQKGINRIVGA